jgi:xylulose-5-phosphate/fructose-6-phosphate phosphoketolase
MIYITGPGTAGPRRGQAYLEGTYSEYYPNVSEDLEACDLFRQFSFPAASRVMSRWNRARYTRAAS